MLLTILEILFFVAAAAFLGIVLGWVLRGLFSNEQAEISDLRARLRKMKKSQRGDSDTAASGVKTKPIVAKPAIAKPAIARPEKAVSATVSQTVKKKPAAKNITAKKAPASKLKTVKAKAVPASKAERAAAQSAAMLGVVDIVKRVGKAESKDDLTKIFGIGPKYQSVLNGMGISSYQQIAKFRKTEIRTVAAAIGSFSGRVERDDWVSGAKSVIKELKKKK